MRYVTAFLSAIVVWVAVVFVLAMFSQAFDGIKGRWQIVPAIGFWGISLGLAALAFRASLRRSRMEPPGFPVDGAQPREKRECAPEDRP